MRSDSRPLSVAIAALGGQGGGVLADWLIEIAESEGTTADFSVRLNAIRQRHAAKGAFVKRLGMFRSGGLL